GVQGQVDALHGMQLSAPGQVEPHMQALDLQHRRPGVAHLVSSRAENGRTRKRRVARWPTRSRGLSASSIDWPTMVQARMTTVTHRPGGMTAHQALLNTAPPVSE